MWPKRWKTNEQKAVPVQQHTALSEAVLRSDHGEMHKIIAAGAYLDEFDNFRMTPLLWAIMRGDIDAVKILLENGADPNVRPNPSDSPLWSAEDDWGFEEIGWSVDGFDLEAIF